MMGSLVMGSVFLVLCCVGVGVGILNGRCVLGSIVWLGEWKRMRSHVSEVLKRR